MRRIISGLGVGLLIIIKWIVKIIFGVLRLFLELVKVLFLLFTLIVRIFLAFVRAGTP